MKNFSIILVSLMGVSACQEEAPRVEVATPSPEEKSPRISSREGAPAEGGPAGAGIGDDAYQAIVYIHSMKRSADGTFNDELGGTGFVISPGGYILTAAHAVFDYEAGYEVKTTATFTLRSGQPYEVQIVDYRQRPDIAILQLPNPMDRDVKWLRFGNSRLVEKGDDLYALGFVPGLEHISMANGILSNPAGKNGNWQTTIPINPGQSGGPVFNSDGEVVAIAIAGDDTRPLVTYAVPGAHTESIRAMAFATDARKAAESAVIAASTAEQAAIKMASEAGVTWKSGMFGEDRASRRFDTDNEIFDGAMKDAMDAAMDAAAEANAGSSDAAAIDQGADG